MKICLDTPNLIKMGQIYPALYFNIYVSFVSLEVIYLAQLHSQRTATLPWQRFQYLLHWWQHTYISQQQEGNAILRFQKWLRERAVLLPHAYIAHLIIFFIYTYVLK
jgi:hypothetical protein